MNKVYDPACGAGSLLLKFAKVLGKENVRIGFYGQEINLTTYNLCRINMFLHDINYNNFNIAHGDTLTDPVHWDDEPFDAIVSNPPYSIKWDLDEPHRQKILTAFSERKDSEYFARLVDNQSISENDYNIVISSYVEQEDTREVVNITELNAEIKQIVAKQSELRTAIDVIVADLEGAK